MKNNEALYQRNIIYLVTIITYLICGIVVLLCKNHIFDDGDFLIGILVLISAVPHFFIFVKKGMFKSLLNIAFLTTAIISIVFGVVFMSVSKLTIDQCCLMWGILGIVQAIIELNSAGYEVKRNKFELIEIAVSTGDIVVGILLCIHLKNGIKMHIIYFGITFLLMATKQFLDMVLLNEKDTDSN